MVETGVSISCQYRTLSATQFFLSISHQRRFFDSNSSTSAGKRYGSLYILLKTHLIVMAWNGKLLQNPSYLQKPTPKCCLVLLYNPQVNSSHPFRMFPSTDYHWSRSTSTLQVVRKRLIWDAASILPLRFLHWHNTPFYLHFVAIVFRILWLCHNKAKYRGEKVPLQSTPFLVRAEMVRVVTAKWRALQLSFQTACSCGLQRNEPLDETNTIHPKSVAL